PYAENQTQKPRIKPMVDDQSRSLLPHWFEAYLLMLGLVQNLSQTTQPLSLGLNALHLLEFAKIVPVNHYFSPPQIPTRQKISGLLLARHKFFAASYY